MNDKANAILAARIRVLRVKHGYTQEYIANKLNISQNIYSRNERNLPRIPLSRLLEIATILNTTAASLLDGL